MKDRNDSQSQSEEQSLESREYRDADGNVHHHTRTYMEQHGKESGSKGGSRDSGKSSSHNKSNR